MESVLQLYTDKYIYLCFYDGNGTMDLTDGLWKSALLV